MGQPETNQEETQRRVLYALMLPAVRVAYAFGVPLRDLGELLQMAYFHEARRHGLKMKEASQHLDISMRKAAQLSSQLKASFAQPDQEHGLPRRIEFALWAQDLSAARLAQVLREEPEDIEVALGELERQQRVRLNPGRTPTWSVQRQQGRLVQDAWSSRLDALQNLLGSVTNAVYGRFFQAEPRAFARTLSLRLRPQDRQALQDLYEKVIWKQLAALDERAKDDPQAEDIDVSLVWAPYEYIQRRLAGDDHSDPSTGEDP